MELSRHRESTQSPGSSGHLWALESSCKNQKVLMDTASIPGAAGTETHLMRWRAGGCDNVCGTLNCCTFKG